MTSLPLWPSTAPFAGIAPGGDEEQNQERRAHVPTLDLFLHPQGGRRPLVVVCPGGGYWTRAEHEGAPVARWLNDLGLHAVVLQYRTWPFRHPAPLWDAQRALRTVRHHAQDWEVDPQRVGILGFSAGGHLAASAGTLIGDASPDHADPIERQSARPDALMLCYPVISMQDWGHSGSRSALIGDKPDAGLRDQLSLERAVGPRTPPTFLWHTSDDAAVRVDHSLQFAAALRQHQIPFALHVYPTGRHGLGLAADHPEAAAWPAAGASWLTALGWRGV